MYARVHAMSPISTQESSQTDITSKWTRQNIKVHIQPEFSGKRYICMRLTGVAIFYQQNNWK